AACLGPYPRRLAGVRGDLRVRQPDDHDHPERGAGERRPAAAPSGHDAGAPSTGLIVKFNGTNWVDEINRSWNAQVPFNLPDRDVFIIDANAGTPALVQGTSSVVGVGTVIFNMAVRPNASNQVYVTNTDARNQVRFESRIPGDPLGRGVQGHI